MKLNWIQSYSFSSISMIKKKGIGLHTLRDSLPYRIEVVRVLAGLMDQRRRAHYDEWSSSNIYFIISFLPVTSPKKSR